jgi:hypothetical protein
VALLLVFAGLPIYQPDLEADTTLQPLALVLSCWLFTTTRQREYFAMSSGERLGLIRSAHPVAGSDRSQANNILYLVPRPWMVVDQLPQGRDRSCNERENKQRLWISLSGVDMGVN